MSGDPSTPKGVIIVQNPFCTLTGWFTGHQRHGLPSSYNCEYRVVPSGRELLPLNLTNKELRKENELIKSTFSGARGRGAVFGQTRLAEATGVTAAIAFCETSDVAVVFGPVEMLPLKFWAGAATAGEATCGGEVF